MAVYDFRSDTVTLPTREMMAAIASAPLGDSGRGDDPTVNALERLATEITGKEEALFLPSGAMANLASVIAHGCHGGEVIVEAEAHIYKSEGGGLSVVAGAIARPVRGYHGVLHPDDVCAAIVPDDHLQVAPTRLISLENTHNSAGGTVMPIETMGTIRDIAQAYGLPVHLDGARLFNAATYLGVEIHALCELVDSVWFAVCKGLGAPVGAMLAGDKVFMRKARRAAKMLGGTMRQAGVIAAPAIVALRDPYAVHRRDHVLATKLARGLAAIDPSLVAVERVQTNIVNCYVDHFASDASEINATLKARGILAISNRTKIRFVTHYHIDEAAVAAAVGAMDDVIATLRKTA